MELAAVLGHSARHSWLVMEKPRAGEVRELNDFLGTLTVHAAFTCGCRGRCDESNWRLHANSKPWTD